VGGKGGNAGGGNGVTKIGGGGLSKGGFFRVKEKVVLFENGENLLEELKMGVHVCCGEEYVIQVNKNVGEMGKKAVHEALEGLGSVAEAKGHVDVFEKAKRSCYCSLRDIRRSHRYLMVSFDKV
jgi:hypothetical protein